MRKLSVALLGSSGVVGQRFVEMLNGHPWFKLSVLTGEKTAGKRYGEAVNWLFSTNIPLEVYGKKIVRLNTHEIDADLVFSSLPSVVAKEAEMNLSRRGLPVISNASSHRLNPVVPLVIPEVNPEHLELIEVQRAKFKSDGFIATDPNCSTVGLAMTLKPIHDLYSVRKVVVSTYQAVSGAGYPGVPSLEIIDNLVPHIHGEEEKIKAETRKILGEINGNRVVNKEIDIEAMCCRVPVVDGHLENVYLETEAEVNVEEVEDAMSSFEGEPQKLKLPTAPSKPIIVRHEDNRPQPRLDRSSGNPPGMPVVVGRVRRGDKKNSLLYTLLVHNTIRGAAGCAVLLAELLVKHQYII